MFGDPLGGLLFGGETLDYFGLAVGPNIDHTPNPGLPFRGTKAGRYSGISRICAYGAPVQAGRLTTIKPTYSNLRRWLNEPAKAARDGFATTRPVVFAASAGRFYPQERQGVISWFEFIVFRRDSR
jgi:hypothetical protein